MVDGHDASGASFRRDRDGNIRVVVLAGQAHELRCSRLADGELHADQPARPAAGVGPRREGFCGGGVDRCGGDTLAAIAELKQSGGKSLENAFTFVSTGGGASLEYLEGKAMPPIEILDQK